MNEVGYKANYTHSRSLQLPLDSVIRLISSFEFYISTEMDETKLWLETLLNRYYHENTISKVISIDSKLATSKGDNYTSVLKRITLDILLTSGRRMKKSVIVKELPLTPYQKIVIDQMAIFEKEILVYRDVLPNLEDILKENCDFSEPMWGKLIEARPYNRLVFEDLANSGYVMANRKHGLDFNHCALVIRSLAKYHASSVILKSKGMISMDILGRHVYQKSELSKLFEDYYVTSFDKLIDAMKTSWEPEWKPIAEKLRSKINGKILDMLLDLLNADVNKFNVLNHGDCWVNNMLFKYGLDDITPISVKFVDFQLAFYNSPAFDLQYFLSTSPNIDVRKDSIQELIDIYHRTLTKQLNLYNYDGDIITIETLKDELKRIDFFSLLVTVTILPVVLLEDVESFPDLEELCKDAVNNGKTQFDFNPFNNAAPNFINIMKDTIKVYVDNHINNKTG